MSDDIGMWQHAKGSRPNPAFGYCTDDVARALVVDMLHRRAGETAELDAGIRRSLKFLSDGFDASSGRFLNMRTAEGDWLANEASEDCHARAMVGLAAVMAEMRDTEFSQWAGDLFVRTIPAAATFTALRPEAAVILACDAAVAAGLPADSLLDLSTSRLVASFDAKQAMPDELPVPKPGRLVALPSDAKVDRRAAALLEWPWPEPVLTYENALVPHALIVAGMRLDDMSLVARGCAVLDWLIDVQSADDGSFSPIGNGNWWYRRGRRSRFDQQPIEAATMVSAAAAAFGATGRRRYLDAAEAAYGWFLGDNDVGIAMADPARGACSDGLSATGRSENQGAESTLMWLTTLEQMRALRPTGEPNADRRTNS
ncbi:MAG TPA: hypothetical protein VF337_02275 [Candidatus Limnocylindrales bacterium]